MKVHLTKFTIATAALALLTAGFTTTAEASRNELVNLIHRLDNLAADFRHEVDAHFKHSDAYRHLVNDANKMYRLVQHIDGLTHDRHSSLRHIESDLEDLDELAHHIHEIVDDIEDGRYGGHKHGQTAHVHRLLITLNNTIHQMQSEVEEMQQVCPNDHNYRHGRASRWDTFRAWFYDYFYEDSHAGHDH